MKSINDLPDEVLLLVAAYLPFPSIVNWSLSCQRFNKISIPSRTQLRHDIIEKFSKIRQDTLEPWPWHRLLLLILTHQLPASYILEVQCDDAPNVEHKFSLDSYDRPAGDILSTPYDRKRATEYDRLIQQAVHDSPWILPAERDTCIADIILGNEEATLAVLLPLLTGMRLLMPPYYSQLPKEVFCRIAQAWKTHERPLPFSRLLIMWTTSENGEYAWPFEEIPKFMSLPSLKRVVLSNPFDQKFPGWPQDTPRPTCPQVYLNGGSISLEALRNIAGAWESPCVIKQQFSNPSVVSCDGPEEPEWDVCVVDGDLDAGRQTFREGTKTINISMQHGGEIWPNKAPWSSFGSEDTEHLNLFNWKELV